MGAGTFQTKLKISGISLNLAQGDICNLTKPLMYLHKSQIDANMEYWQDNPKMEMAHFFGYHHRKPF